MMYYATRKLFDDEVVKFPEQIEFQYRLGQVDVDLYVPKHRLAVECFSRFYYGRMVKFLNRLGDSVDKIVFVVPHKRVGYLIENCVNDTKPQFEVDIWIADEVGVEWERKNMGTVIIRSSRYKSAIRAFHVWKPKPAPSIIS